MMDYQAFSQTVARLLSRMGYEDVKIVRTRRTGKNTDGGADITALLPGDDNDDRGDRRNLVVVQLKQFPPAQRVFRRNVDELQGVRLRHGAGRALLITTGTFSSAVELPGVTSSEGTLRLIDGETLVRLLEEYEEVREKEQTESRTPLPPADLVRRDTASKSMRRTNESRGLPSCSVHVLVTVVTAEPGCLSEVFRTSRGGHGPECCCGFNRCVSSCADAGKREDRLRGRIRRHV